MNKINFVKLLQGYTAGWVAVSSDFSRVLFSGKTLEEVMKKVRESKSKVYYFPADQSYGNFIGS